MKSTERSEWSVEDVWPTSVCFVQLCVWMLLRRSESQKRNCYFLFFHQKSRLFFINSNIKHTFKWIGKRWQWIFCESFEFSSENWSQKKYVVCSVVLLYIFSLRAYASSSSSFQIEYTASAAVFFLRTQRTLMHTPFASFVRGSSLKRVIVKTILTKRKLILHSIQNCHSFSSFFFLFFPKNIFLKLRTIKCNVLELW